MRLSTLKGMFFDRGVTRRFLDPLTYHYLSHKAGFIRLTARRSQRWRKGPSAPGTPPHAHIGHMRRLLWYAFDRGNRSVVVGPYGFERKGFAATNPTVPELHEFGGVMVRTNRKGRTQLYRYPARPYMAPALEAAEATGQEGEFWAEAWRRAVKTRR